MFKQCYVKKCFFTTLHSTTTKHDLRPLCRELAGVGCCCWFAMWFAMFGKAISTPADLDEIEKGIPNPQSFSHKNCMLGGLRGNGNTERPQPPVGLVGTWR